MIRIFSQKKSRARAAALSLAALVLAGGALTAYSEPPSARPAAPQPPAVVQAQQLSQAFSHVADQVSPAVVSLRVEQAVQARPSGPFRFGFPFSFGTPQENGPMVRRGSGSGVVIRPNGYILTNNHVVADARRIVVVFQDGTERPGEIVGTDPATDLAVVRVQATGLRAARLASTDSARVGEWTIAIGAPFGLDYTVTAGVLSAKGRGGLGANEIEDYLQTDASINPGNSGGPLCNLQGEVLGINTMIVGRGTGIGFAIPSDLASNVASQIIADGRVRRSWLGVGFQELTPDLASHFGTSHRTGALIGHVADGSPAARAGIRSGDVVVSVGGDTIRESRDLLRRVLRAPVGESLAVELLRSGRRRTVQVVTAERPQRDGEVEGQPSVPGQGNRDFLGLSVQRLNPALRRRVQAPAGAELIVTAVRQGSAAERAGLRSGDVLISADQRPVRTERDLRRALRDGNALLSVARAQRTFFTVLRSDAASSH